MNVGERRFHAISMGSRSEVLNLELDIEQAKIRLRNLEEDLKRAKEKMAIDAIEKYIDKFSKILSQENVLGSFGDANLEDINKAIELMKGI